MSFLEDGREWRLPGILYADHLVLCGESGNRRRREERGGSRSKTGETMEGVGATLSKGREERPPVKGKENEQQPGKGAEVDSKSLGLQILSRESKPFPKEFDIN